MTFNKLSAALRGTMAAALMAGTSCFASAALAEPDMLLRAGHSSALTSTGHAALEMLNDRLMERTDGRIGIQIFPNSQLGGEREQIESIQLGNLDMAYVSTAPVASFDQDFFVLDLPFAFKDRDAVFRVLDGEVGHDLLDGLQNVGLVGLAFWENGFRQLANDKKVVHTPDDLAGMKMRTMENEVHIATWRELGANPSPLSFSELFTSLQQGTFDAMESPINLFYDMKFNEVQSYISRTNHLYGAWVLLMSPDTLAMLSDEDREIFMQAVAETTADQRALAIEADDKAMAAMPEVTITDLTDEELAAFSEQMAPVYDLVAEKVGDELVQKVVAAAKGE
ncbi:TRAP transporter substrate-binding protein [Celeribacter halophilus]|uniref:Tripartite ATP-independent transporter solute receptor, DctP family n=1 Tax=Celeribacter halophilus TaxID=576117 RepID=A0A1I3WVN4_9RHOB|nr:TRAP transporter substrate-binding protein [Celeribacter halophilus]PZX05540.1 tripartite ATP-independent transporter DctP family solute receptor [Celeribacter halophilus]SFK11209.1 tripartite ATP-independent transporter solute receptor, DctP family [Celeribacter halophilus]